MTPPAPRALVAVYTLFAVAAGARAAVQLAVQGAAAPAAHLLSAVAAAVYLVAAVSLRRPSPAALRRARAALIFEAAGVLLVGTITVLAPDLLGDDTVWSRFGAGYGYVPLALPFVGLWVIHVLRREPAGVGGTVAGAG